MCFDNLNDIAFCYLHNHTLFFAERQIVVVAASSSYKNSYIDCYLQVFKADNIAL